MISHSKVKKTPKEPQTLPTVIKPIYAERDWQPIFTLADEHGNIINAVPHFTEKNMWVVPGGKVCTQDALEAAGARPSSTMLWPRYWT